MFLIHKDILWQFGQAKKIEEKTWKLFGEEILKKLRDTRARVEFSKREINEINISKDLDLSGFLIDWFFSFVEWLCCNNIYTRHYEN